MTDTTIHFEGWTALGCRDSLRLASWDWIGRDTSDDLEADLIPDWAAITVAIGALVAIGGFVSAFFRDDGWPVLALTFGLIAVAIGMKAAENAITAKSEWQPLSNG